MLSCCRGCIARRARRAICRAAIAVSSGICRNRQLPVHAVRQTMLGAQGPTLNQGNPHQMKVPTPFLSKSTRPSRHPSDCHIWVWLKLKQEGQTAAFGPCFHLPGHPILVFRFFDFSPCFHLPGVPFWAPIFEPQPYPTRNPIRAPGSPGLGGCLSRTAARGAQSRTSPRSLRFFSGRSRAPPPPKR